MSVKFKKWIKENFETIIIEHNFKYSKVFSSHDAMCYVKFVDEEPSPEWVKEYWKNPVGEFPKNEMITIYKSRWDPTVAVKLSSKLRKPRVQKLEGFKPDYKIEKWWSIASSYEAENSAKEILDLLNKYAWEWFVLK